MEDTKMSTFNKSNGRELTPPNKEEVQKYIDEVTEGKDLFIARASKETPPKALAISIETAIQQGKAVKVSGVGAAVITMYKAIASVENSLYPRYDIQYKPIQEPKRVSKGSNESEDEKYVILSALIYDRNKFKRREPDFEREIIVEDILNNKQLIENTIEYYAEKGYNLNSLAPINCEGRTSYIYGVFKKDRNK